MTKIFSNELTQNIGSEKKEFVVQSKRDQPIGKMKHQLNFSIAFFLISTTTIIIIGQSEGYGFSFPILFMSLFILIGVSLLFNAISILSKKGSLYVGTPKRLIIYRKGNIRSIDWEQFTGVMTINENYDGGNILLELRTGIIIPKSENIPERLDLEEIYISGIRNLYEVEKVCRERIWENNPSFVSKQKI